MHALLNEKSVDINLVIAHKTCYPLQLYNPVIPTKAQLPVPENDKVCVIGTHLHLH